MEHTPRHLNPETYYEAHPLRSFRETLAAMRILAKRGYAERENMVALKEEVAFVLRQQQKAGALTPELRDGLLDLIIDIERELQS